MHKDINIYGGCTTKADQLNLICFSTPDGSEEWFQLINYGSSTCAKVNWCLLVIMAVLMNLNDTSRAQMITNSLVGCMFFFFFYSKSSWIYFPSFFSPFKFKSPFTSSFISWYHFSQHLTSQVINEMPWKSISFLSFCYPLSSLTSVLSFSFMNI